MQMLVNNTSLNELSNEGPNQEKQMDYEAVISVHPFKQTIDNQTTSKSQNSFEKSVMQNYESQTKIFLLKDTSMSQINEIIQMTPIGMKTEETFSPTKVAYVQTKEEMTSEDLT
jgi:hypothetical protein